MLSIDTTAVLLAPIGLALAAELGLSALPFAFASIWLANSASLLLPVSNLTNLLAQERLGLGATGFVRETWVPRRLPSYDPVLLWLAAFVVVLIGPAIILGVPAWVVAVGASVVLVAGFVVLRPKVVHPSRLVRLASWWCG